MEFQKIILTKQQTLNVTYKNEDGDIIQFVERRGTSATALTS
mgnify:CR=1 FL=1